ncbi:sensor histidine kinase [Paenibacillus lycopersici]|nr:HAMP domain-containing sensor histidine kinase [Paenibacillus lycopersici]
MSLDDRGKYYMNTAVDELDRAELIISDFLNYAKPREARIQAIDLTLLLQNMHTLMSTMSTMRGILMHTFIDEGLSITGDQVKLKQVIINLIKNAIEATPNGGSVEIRAYRQEEGMHVEIADTGAGMTEEQLGKLGSVSHTTKASGSGVGLMDAYQIIHGMGGRLSFESAVGVGTKATIRLPAGEKQTPKS